MGADRFKKQWRFPDHKSWVHARINSHNKKNFLQDLKLVLTRCGVLDRFKEGPFGQYLEMIQPIRVHGMLIYNLLKRQLICPEEEKDDEMWFGLGEKKARFGREEFCLCSGLNMGTLPEGFQEKEEVSEESILTRYFVDENPSIELLEATFNRLTEPSEGDDALKMGYLLMVSQFFGMDEARTAIPSWVLSLVEDIDAFESFPWGSYIFDVTLCCLKNAAEKHIEKLRGNGEKKEENEGPKNKKRKKKEEENKEEKKKKPKKKKKKTDNQQAELDNQQNNDDSKCFTFHVYGFLLAFQVWAVERICRLEDDAEERENAIEEGDASIHQSKTTTRFIGSRKSDEPSSKKRLFDDGDVETPKSKIKTSVSPNLSPLHNFNDGEKLEKDLNKEDVEEVERAKVEKAEVEMAEVEKAEDKDDTGMAEVEKAEVEMAENKDDTRVFTGQPVDMNREQFNNLVKPTKWLSNLHIDSYLDVLWKRRRSNGEVSDCQEIGLVPTAFFAHLKLKWEAFLNFNGCKNQSLNLQLLKSYSYDRFRWFSLASSGNTNTRVGDATPKQVSDFIKLIRSNDNEMDSKLNSMNVSLSFASTVEIFHVLNSEKVPALCFLDWIKLFQPELYYNSDVCSLAIDNCGRLDDYETMRCLLGDYNVNQVCLTDKAFGFLNVMIASKVSTRKCIGRVVEVLNGVGGSCRVSGVRVLIEVLSVLRSFEMAKYVISKTAKKLSYYHILIREMCRRFYIKGAQDLLNEMRQVGCEPSSQTYNYIISSLCKNGKNAEARELFKEMQEHNCPPDAATYEIFIWNCCRFGEFDAAFQFLDDMAVRGLEPRHSTHAAFIKSYFSLRRFKEAYEYVVGSADRYKSSCNICTAGLQAFILGTTMQSWPIMFFWK
ncbi:hypothetical protein LWI29_007635 [Acer saccharum]|uniref:DUF1985 domain-containing protein n=1 Tax=Acer saccharum TaxID=4024 RepID=A0AA39RCH6_ACESA|nr:hypothetical protein LWI29_007635 [Acer saccharum]